MSLLKRCFTCRVSKPLASFSNHAQKKDGKNPNCKQCDKAKRDAKRPPRKYQPKMDEQEAREIALRYDIKGDFREQEPRAYNRLGTLGVLEEATAHQIQRERGPDKHSRDSCLESALKFDNPKAWERGDNPKYAAARHHGWYDECTAHMTHLIKPSGHWEVEVNVMESAGRHEFKEDWKAAERGAYDSALRNGWFEKATAHMPDVWGKWNNKEDVIADAQKYPHSSAWKRANAGAYGKAVEKGWLEEATAHMARLQKPVGYWTKETVFESAQPFDCPSDWRRQLSTAWHRAYQNGWMEECTAHMSRKGSGDNDVVYLWENISDPGIFKVGITSDSMGETRIRQCCAHNAMEARIIFMLKVQDAREVERALLQLGASPEYSTDIDGYTEFRKLSDSELSIAVSIAYEAGLPSWCQAAGSKGRTSDPKVVSDTLED